MKIHEKHQKHFNLLTHGFLVVLGGIVVKIIVVVGLPLSGKTTHCKIIGEKKGIPLVETGTFVFKEVEKRGLEATPENVQKVAGECKAISDSYFTERAVEFIETTHNDAPAVFISGIKARSEVEFLVEKFGKDNVKIIAFHASPDTRFARLGNPDRTDDTRGSKTEEDKAMREDRTRFELRDRKELGYGVGTLIALSDHVINTEDRRWPYHNFEYTIREFGLIMDDIISGA